MFQLCRLSNVIKGQRCSVCREYAPHESRRVACVTPNARFEHMASNEGRISPPVVCGHSPDRTSCHRHKHGISYRPKLGPELLFRSVSICAHSLSDYGWRSTLLLARLVVLALRPHPDAQDSNRRSPWSVHFFRSMQVSPCPTDSFSMLRKISFVLYRRQMARLSLSVVVLVPLSVRRIPMNTNVCSRRSGDIISAARGPCVSADCASLGLAHAQ